MVLSFLEKKTHLFLFLTNNVILYWQILRHFVLQCMMAASEKRFKSIAFPAIGTGVLNFPPSVVAKVMFETVTLYKNQYPDCSLKTVEFVIYPKDTATVEVCLYFIQWNLFKPNLLMTNFCIRSRQVFTLYMFFFNIS